MPDREALSPGPVAALFLLDCKPMHHAMVYHRAIRLKQENEMTDKKPTRSQEVAEDIAALLRARSPLLWIVTREEARVEGYIFEAAASIKYITRTWDVAQGAAEFDGRPFSGGSPDPGAMLEVIRNRAVNKNVASDRCVWIMRDLQPWLPNITGATVVRALRNLARTLPSVEDKDRAQAVIVLTPSKDVPPELVGHATVIDWPLPDREEIGEILDAAVESMPEAVQKKALPKGSRDAAVDAAVGLTGEEAAACYASSLVRFSKIDPVAVAKEKKRVIAREGVLEWFDPLPGGLDAVGGLEALKAFLVKKNMAYSPEARAYGLPSPKGVFIAGITGCGKSLTAKAAATAFGVPLLRLDLNSLKSKYVGESEGNLRKAIEVIEAIGRCVVWLDEVEKAMQGATGGAADGGVSADALGTILTWMQERRGQSFVIATANDVTALPPEFLRKGRFDEVFWVDLPNAQERGAVVSAALRTFDRSPANFDLDRISDATEGFTGAEIAAIVPDALFSAFAENGREVATDDVIAAAATVRPVSKTAADKIAKMREWGQTYRNASAPMEEVVPGRRKIGRKLEIA